MLEKYYPYEYAMDVFEIDYPKLYQLGYRGIVFDIDNTLVHHGDDSTKEIDALFASIHALGFQTLLLTNNDEARVLRFIQNIPTQYIYEAGKPDPKCFLEAVEKLGLPKEKVIYVGDQVFTDIIGANAAGLANILVHFIQLPEEKWIGKRRYIEKVILFFYRHNKKYYQRLGNIVKKGR